MSVSIATLGMFSPSVGSGTTYVGTGGVITKETPKPSIRVKNLKIDNKLKLKDKDFIKIKYVE